MNRNYLLKGLEAAIALAASYLSTQAFLNSSIYNSIKTLTTVFLGRVPMTASMTSASISELLTQVIIVSMLILTTYTLLWGLNKLILYSVNSLLLFTEVLSYSNLNWLNLFGIPYDAIEKRPTIYPLAAGLVVMMGYLLLLVGNEVDKGVKELHTRGGQKDQLEKIQFRQSSLLVGVAFLSTTIVVGIFTLTSQIGVLYNFLVKDLPNGYLILGIASATIIILSLVIYLRIYSNTSEQTPKNLSTST